MPADNVEFSGDRRFHLYYWADKVGTQDCTWIRVFHSPTSRTVLDLTDNACSVDSYAFSPDGKLLHLRLSRLDRSVVAYPATLDLSTGLYYHHPDPRQAHAPAGHAEDLEHIARTGRPPPEHAPNDPVRWPRPEELDWPEVPGEHLINKPVTPEAPAPPATPPPALPTPTASPPTITLQEPSTPPAVAAKTPGQFQTPNNELRSPDGQYLIEFSQFEMRMSHWVQTAIIRHLPTDKTVADFTQTLYDVTAAFHPEPHWVTLSLHKYPGDRPSFTVLANLQTQTYLHVDANGRPLDIAYPLATLTRAG